MILDVKKGDKSTWTWRPISEDELRAIVNDQREELSDVEASYFEEVRVKSRKAVLRRSEICGDESVFVVAIAETYIIYFDDVEDGFNLGTLSADDCVLDPSGGQWSLAGALDALRLATSRL